MCYDPKIVRKKLSLSYISKCEPDLELEFVEFHEEIKVLLAEKYSFVIYQRFHGNEELKLSLVQNKIYYFSNFHCETYIEYTVC
jgi:hypothetical protein